MNAGDMTAFDELYAEHYNYVYQKAVAKLHNPQDAEEATNDAFMQIWKAFSHTDWKPSLKNFGAWFNTVTHNAIVVYYHRKNRKRDVVHRLSTEAELDWVENTVLDPNATDPLSEIVNDDFIHHIEDALCCLRSSRQRLAWMLRHFEGYKFKEIADILNTNPSNVKYYVELCNKALRRLLKQKGLEA